MMVRYVQFTLSDGDNVILETDEAAPPGGVVRAGRPEDSVLPVTEKFEDAAAKALNTARVIMDQVRAWSEGPHQVEITFGLKASGEGHIIIAKAGLEANFGLKLAWTREGAPRSAA
jgi:NTP-dependent ternary system trypsin peptidase co-occuring protein